MKISIKTFQGHWALVTGASSGIGAEFARQLAVAGLNLVLVARREDRLSQLAAELRSACKINTQVMALDLATLDAVQTIKTRLSTDGIRIRLLCNNAAFARWGHVENYPPEFYSAMIRANADVVVGLCLAFREDLISHGSAVIINVSSPAALQPMPYLAVYAATKSFLHGFSLALHGEWAESGILVQTLVPGPTATELDETSGSYETALGKRAPVGDVVRRSLAHLAYGSPLVTTARGLFKQRLMVALLPASTLLRTLARMFRPPQGKSVER